MATTAKVGGSALWKADSRSFFSVAGRFAAPGMLIPAKIQALTGTLASLLVHLPDGNQVVLNNVVLDATQTAQNSYSILDQTT